MPFYLLDILLVMKLDDIYSSLRLILILLMCFFVQKFSFSCSSVVFGMCVCVLLAKRYFSWLGEILLTLML